MLYNYHIASTWRSCSSMSGPGTAEKVKILLRPRIISYELEVDSIIGVAVEPFPDLQLKARKNYFSMKINDCGRLQRFKSWLGVHIILRNRRERSNFALHNKKLEFSIHLAAIICFVHSIARLRWSFTAKSLGLVLFLNSKTNEKRWKQVYENYSSGCAISVTRKREITQMVSGIQKNSEGGAVSPTLVERE